MSVSTIHKRRGYVSVPNATALDGRLSCRALGLLVTLLARPAGASVDVRKIAKGDPRPGREGRDALLRALAELKRAGLVHQFTIPNPGRGITTHTVVDGEPMTEQEAADTLAERLDGPANGRKGSESSTPRTSTPSKGSDSKTPRTSTALATQGHPSSQARGNHQRGPSALATPSAQTSTPGHQTASPADRVPAAASHADLPAGDGAAGIALCRQALATARGQASQDREGARPIPADQAMPVGGCWSCNTDGPTDQAGLCPTCRSTDAREDESA